jgi:hypothetical protein
MFMIDGLVAKQGFLKVGEEWKKVTFLSYAFV